MNKPDRDIVALAKRIKRGRVTALRQMGATAVNHFKDSFVDSGFTDKALVKWKKPLRMLQDQSGKYVYKKIYGKKLTKSDRLRPVLVQTGKLRRSIHVSQNFPDSVRIMSNMPYSARHNFGLKKMPKRQFMGNSARLNDKERKVIDNVFHRIMPKI